VGVAIVVVHGGVLSVMDIGDVAILVVGLSVVDGSISSQISSDTSRQDLLNVNLADSFVAAKSSFIVSFCNITLARMARSVHRRFFAQEQSIRSLTATSRSSLHAKMVVLRRLQQSDELHCLSINVVDSSIRLVLFIRRHFGDAAYVILLETIL
jgi:hypothetical protein